MLTPGGTLTEAFLSPTACRRRPLEARRWAVPLLTDQALPDSRRVDTIVERLRRIHKELLPHAWRCIGRAEELRNGSIKRDAESTHRILRRMGGHRP